MKNFFVQLGLFTVLIAALNFCWIKFAPLEKHVPHIWMMIVFFASMTSLFHLMALNASKGKPQAFIRYYMGSTGIRLFMYAIIILAYRFYDKPTLVPFAIGFMVHYLLFTVFEVPVLLKELRRS